MRRLFNGVALLTLMGGCALQPTYQPPALDIAARWTNGRSAPMEAASSQAARQDWWTRLADPGVDRLVAAGLSDNPTLAETAARVDQARASLSIQDAGRSPGLGVNASVQASRDRAAGGETISQTSASGGIGLTWELDLWGRVRAGAAAARYRLTAAEADAQAARLSVSGEIVDTLLALRVCDRVLAIRDADIASREAELATTRARLMAGGVAPVTVEAALGALSVARIDRIIQSETCGRLVNALAALSGLGDSEIRQLALGAIPASPAFAPALPATVLLSHPAVVSAEREVAARWSEIAVARAERLPRVDLAVALSGQWLRALRTSTSYGARSTGLGMAGPLFDGGAGAARVRGAEAAYRQASARLDLAVRAATREVEDALAAQQSAQARLETSREALRAADATLTANIARWRAGAIAQVELEDARRQFSRAQESVVIAAADQARAWVALVRTTGGANP